MFLKKVHLVNFCQHLDRVVEFGHGLNVIVGPNGSGKSNILNGIYGCLTGDFGRNAGKAADNISINKIPNKGSFVETEFTHNGYDMTMLRRLEPADRKLVIGKDIYTADKDVAEKLYNVLEVDKDILNQYVFVEQWDHFGPLSLAPSKRAAAFQKIFKIDQLAKISDELADGSVKLSSVNIGNSDIQILETSLNELSEKIKNLEELIANTKSVDTLDSELTLLNDTLNNWKIKQKLLESVSSRKASIKTLQKTRESLDKTLSDLNTSILSLSDYSENNLEAYNLANQTESSWLTYDFYLYQKKALDNKLDALIDEKSKNPEPVKPERYQDNVKALNDKLDAVKFKHSQHKQFLSSIDFENDFAECPTCGTPAKNLIDKYNQAKTESQQLLSEITELTTIISDNASYDKKAALYLSWFSGYNNRLTEVSSQLVSLKVEEQPKFSREEAGKIINDFNKNNEQINKVAKQISKIDSDIASNEATQAQQIVELNNENLELSKYLNVTEEVVKEAQINIAKIKEDKVKINKLVTELAVDKAELKALSEKIDNLRKQKEIALLHSSWNDRVDSLKKVFKFNALPTILSYKYMDKVVVELNNTLNDIGLPFNIKLEDDLSFTANFGSHEVPATRLSGGQKIMLTIAYRLAINFTFATNLGLLCLDEPTVGLDDANLGALEKAFERLKQFSLANGVQIVVVTHEKGISHLFDHTIDLSKV